MDPIGGHTIVRCAQGLTVVHISVQTLPWQPMTEATTAGTMTSVVSRVSYMVTLPWPPSVNAYYRAPRVWTQKGGYSPRVLISAAGRAYRTAVAQRTLGHRPRAPLACRLSVHIDAYPPDRRKRDLDNLLKAVLDALQHAGFYLGDDQIDDLRIRRCGLVVGGELTVGITEAPCPAQ